ncbi:MAG: hypothetical protein Kow0081_3100 [Candidatus Dojkabacteria bacterium]
MNRNSETPAIITPGKNGTLEVDPQNSILDVPWGTPYDLADEQIPDSLDMQGGTSEDVGDESPTKVTHIYEAGSLFEKNWHEGVVGEAIASSRERNDLALELFRGVVPDGVSVHMAPEPRDIEDGNLNPNNLSGSYDQDEAKQDLINDLFPQVSSEVILPMPVEHKVFNKANNSSDNSYFEASSEVAQTKDADTIQEEIAIPKMQDILVEPRARKILEEVNPKDLLHKLTDAGKLDKIDEDQDTKVEQGLKTGEKLKDDIPTVVTDNHPREVVVPKNIGLSLKDKNEEFKNVNGYKSLSIFPASSPKTQSYTPEFEEKAGKTGVIQRDNEPEILTNLIHQKPETQELLDRLKNEFLFFDSAALAELVEKAEEEGSQLQVNTLILLLNEANETIKNSVREGTPSAVAVNNAYSFLSDFAKENKKLLPENFGLVLVNNGNVLPLISGHFAVIYKDEEDEQQVLTAPPGIIADASHFVNIPRVAEGDEIVVANLQKVPISIRPQLERYIFEEAVKKKIFNKPIGINYALSGGKVIEITVTVMEAPNSLVYRKYTTSDIQSSQNFEELEG